MSFTGTGNSFNHWTSKEALKVCLVEYTSEELSELTNKQLISLASSIDYHYKMNLDFDKRTIELI